MLLLEGWVNNPAPLEELSRQAWASSGCRQQYLIKPRVQVNDALLPADFEGSTAGPGATFPTAGLGFLVMARAIITTRLLLWSCNPKGRGPLSR